MENKPVIFEKKKVFCNRLIKDVFVAKEVVGDNQIVDKPIDFYKFEESIAGAVFPTLKLSQEMYNRMVEADIEQKEVDLMFIFKVNKKGTYGVEVFDFNVINPKK